MPAFDYLEARAVAAELIAEFGAPAILRKPPWRGGTAAAPTFSEQASFPVIAVDLGIKTTWRDGSTVQETTRTLYVSTEGLPQVDGVAIVPAQGDRIAIIGEGDEGLVTDDGAFLARSHEIAQVLPLAPAGVVVFWELRISI